jgi:periplasmic divalent cation tolerance protein
MTHILIYIPTSSEAKAEKIALALIEDKLIACANMSRVKSIYPWEGKIETAQEVALLAKTEESKFSAVEKRVKELHSYEIPLIAKIPVEFNKEYAEWVKSILS